MKTIKLSLILLLLSCSIGCTQLDFKNSVNSDRFKNTVALSNSNTALAEVATPKIIKELERDLQQYVPQVEIITPQAEQTFARTEVNLKLKVEDLPVFREDKLQLGNHLNLIVDNEPLRSIYSLNEPIVVKGLAPGTHTIRAFAARPWGESFKNEGAYAQTTFNVLTETNDNRPDSSQPLLTYNSPTGTYGAEPLLLDFYLTNAPLHAIAKSNPELKDWRIRATVNGTSFILENWQPIYLTGLEPGDNWVQLELIDEAGNNIENAFNNTVRVFTYDPQQQDTLAQLVTERIPLTTARSIVQPNYGIEPVKTALTIELENSVDDSVNTSDTIEPTVTERPFPAIAEPTVSTLNESPRTPTVVEIPDNKLQEPTVSETVAEPNIEPKVEPEIVLNKDSQPADSTAVTEETIVITAADSDREVTTIVIPQPKSDEISESEIAIRLPQTQPNDNFSELEQSPSPSRWWKKILVGLRQKIEALARQLPDEA
jgi:hypothetical protein